MKLQFLVIVFAITAIGLFLIGCASPQVVSAGPDTYIVADSGGIYTQNSGPIRAEVFRIANQFCETNGLVMLPIAVDERPYVLGHNTASVKLTFRAVSPKDAKNWKEENLQQNPPDDLYSELKKLDELRKQGILTDQEFDAQKKKLLESH